MECMFKLGKVVVCLDLKTGLTYKQYHYQECAMTGCRAWQDTLQDCRLALGGMENTTLWAERPNTNGGGG